MTSTTFFRMDTSPGNWPSGRMEVLMKTTAIILLLSVAPFLVLRSASAEAPTASEILERSIAHHDPDGRWGRDRFTMTFRETRPDGSERRTRIAVHDPLRAFEIQTQRDGAEIEGLMAGEECVLALDGSTEFTVEDREKYRLTCKRLEWMRNYYTYL